MTSTSRYGAGPAFFLFLSVLSGQGCINPDLAETNAGQVEASMTADDLVGFWKIEREGSSKSCTVALKPEADGAYLSLHVEACAIHELSGLAVWSVEESVLVLRAKNGTPLMSMRRRGPDSLSSNDRRFRMELTPMI